MNHWINALFELIYPPILLKHTAVPIEDKSCTICCEPYQGEEMPELPWICPRCINRDWFLDQARSAYRAEGSVRQLILAFKYKKEFHHLPQLVQWIEEGYRFHYAKKEPPFDALVPVPLHPRKFRERGFNQADEIASILSRRIHIPCLKALKRVHESPTQTQLSRIQRLKNSKGAFEVKSQFDIKTKRLLILDDVFTTGATADACAQALKRAGAAYVASLTIARG